MPRERAWTPTIEGRINLDEALLSGFCDRWRIARLEVFGSIVRDDVGPDSDADVLVTFRPDADWGLIDHARMEEELTALFGRRVDLLTRRAVERSANTIRRDAIIAGAVPLFTAPDSRIPVQTSADDRGAS